MSSWVDFLKSLPRSFYSPAMYREVARSWRGSGLGHLAKLALFTLLAGLWLNRALYFEGPSDFNQYVVPFLAQMPELHLRDGELQVDAPMPYSLKKIDDGLELVFFDTTGQIKSIEEIPGPVLFLFTKRSIQYQTKKGTESFDLARVPFDLDWTREMNESFLRRMSFLIGLAPVFNKALFFVLFTLVAVFCWIFGLLLSELSPGFDLSVGAVARLTAAAATPFWLLHFVLVEVIEIRIGCAQVFLALLLNFLYLIFALLANYRTPESSGTGSAGPKTDSGAGSPFSSSS